MTEVKEATSAAPETARLDPGPLGAIEETMLITLWARAMESRHPRAIVRDEAAARLLREIDYDFSRFARGWKSQIGVAVRTRWLDDAVGAFIRRHPDAIVVNLGAGLDTRFLRLDNGTIHWFDLDTPEATALRRRCLPESDRNRFVDCCAFDPSWIEDVRLLGPRPVMIVSEGVLMFFERERVRRLVDRLARAFPGGEMLFDAIGGVMVRLPWLHDTLPKTRARFRWGLTGARELRAWSDRADVLGVRPMLEETPERWRWMRWLRYVPVMRRQFVVAHLRFRETPGPNVDIFSVPSRLAAGLPFPLAAGPDPMDYLSADEKTRLQEQLKECVQERKVLSKRIEVARELGDLKENADYHAAREDQGMNEAKIRDLEYKLATSVVTDDEAVPEDMVFLGATVKLRDVESGDEDLYRLVGSTSDSFDADVIEVTPRSPLGEALMKSRVGEVVRVDLRRGPKRMEIVEIV